MILRRSAALTGAVAVLEGAALLVASGCGASSGLSWAGPAPHPVVPCRDSVAGLPDIGPVADLSGAEIFVPKLFFGLGLGQVHPADCTLRRSAIYDVVVSYDAWGPVGLELMFGQWKVEDEPYLAGTSQVNVTGATNELQMQPLLAMLSLSYEPVRWDCRFYVGVGGGYSMYTSYNVSSDYRAEVLDNGYPSYDADASDFWLFQAAAGAEVFSSTDAKLNIGFEARYLTGNIEWTQNYGGSPVTGNLDTDFFVLRTYLSWHF